MVRRSYRPTSPVVAYLEEGSFLMDTTLYPVLLGDVLRQHLALSHDDLNETFDFLARIICILPSDRASVRDMSRHRWLSSV